MRHSASYILILGLLLTSCDLVSSDSQNSIRVVDFKTLFQSFETETDIHEFETVILIDTSDVNDFLSEFPSDKYIKDQLLDVTFTDSLVVGVFVGQRPNISYTVSIDSVVVSSKSSLVYITETGSASGGRAITWPAHFVVVSKAEFNHKEAGFPFKRICKVKPCAWPTEAVPPY